VNVDGDGGGAEKPVAGAEMMEGTDKADGDDGHAQLLGETETAFFEFVDVAVSGAFGFGKNNQADSAVYCLLRQAPEPLQILGAADTGHGHVAESLHQPAIHRDAKVGFEFPAPDQLRNRAIEDEGVEQVDVVHHEERGARGVEAGRLLDDHFCAGKKRDAAAEAALKIVVLARIENDGQRDEDRDNEKKVQPAHTPEKPAAQEFPEALHT